MRLENQAASAVLMVRPEHFASNPDTLASNCFQRAAAASAELKEAALREFEALAAALSGAGIAVHVFPGGAEPASPDEVFPNNWLSTHADGSVVLYPLMAPSRRLERRAELIAALSRNYRTSRIIDLSGSERAGAFLEGTGSLVLDRPNHAAYASLSPRTSRAAIERFEAELGYSVHVFQAVDSAGSAVYHTNVLMSLGSGFAVVCGAALRAASERRSLFSRLEASGRTVIDIDFGQMAAFAANLLELAAPSGPVAALSVRALASLDPGRRRALERYAALLPVDVTTIETYGGGGVRCMLAEVHLPAAG
ncbi:MAG TPA: arginine deiminase-related protein [Gammaproteobacteria bacterium]|nr:arginine deiminase-related protein [Gammaproteobacteria bacterium]